MALSHSPISLCQAWCLIAVMLKIHQPLTSEEETDIRCSHFEKAWWAILLLDVQFDVFGCRTFIWRVRSWKWSPLSHVKILRILRKEPIIFWTTLKCFSKDKSWHGLMILTMMEMKRKQILVGWLGNVHVILRRLSRRRVKMLDLCQKAFIWTAPLYSIPLTFPMWMNRYRAR